MKPVTIIGIILIILGTLGFVYKGITYTEKEEVLDLGPVEVQSEEEETIPIPEVLSGIAVAGGIILVVAGSKRKTQNL